MFCVFFYVVNKGGMNMTKKLASILLMGAMGLSVLTGCSSQGGSVNETTNEVTGVEASMQVEEVAEEVAVESGLELTEFTAYGVIDPQISAQQIVADKMGYFAEEGLTVTNQFVQSGGEISPLIAGNTAAVSFESSYTDIALAANGVKVKILAPMANIGDTQSVVARKGLDLTSAKDLEGKKLGISSGAGVLIAIRNMCEALGVDIDQIEMIILAPSDQIAAIERGDIDLMACWEPWVSNAVETGGTLLFSGLNAYLPEKQGSVEWLNFYTTLQVTEDFLTQNPNTVEAMLRALVKATDFINTNREEAAELIATEINLDKEQVLEIMGKNVYAMDFDESFLKSTEEMAQFMKEMDNITAVPELTSYIDEAPLTKVLAQ